jgi:hypothetical protein
LTVEVITKRSIFSYSLFFSRRVVTFFLLLLFGYYLTRLLNMHQNGLITQGFLASPLGNLLF